MADPGHGRPAAGRWLRAADRYADGLAVDLGLYLLSALFAGVTAVTASLPPHGAWGRIAVIGYGVATLATLGQLLARSLARRAGMRREGGLTGARSAGMVLAGTGTRGVLTGLVWAAAALVPLLVEAGQRSTGRLDRAQEEVVVVEHGGQRLLDAGTPYLDHAAIAALPADQRLLGYLPYQPGMALFGLPRAAFGVAWWTDARVWFALVTALTIGAALVLLRRGFHAGGAPAAQRARRTAHGADPAPLVRAAQAATVVPLGALALAVGGDDLPVLGLCLLALACVALRRFGWAGLAVGAAGALKLFAWPVAAVLLAAAIVHSRRTEGRAGRALPGHAVARYTLGALGLPVLSLVPAFLVDPGAAVENAVRFPLGLGLVESPAASPFPGHLIAAGLPGGRVVAGVLLALAALAIGWWLVRRPPRDARSAALVCATGLLAATLLLPATRFGYLLYPMAYAVWAPALKLER